MIEYLQETLRSFQGVAQSVHFFYIALFGAGMLTVSILLGGLDHDIDHDVDHDHDHGEGNMSILTFKTFWMFMVGFGGGGYFGAEAHASVLVASLCGLGGGIVMGGLGYGLLNFFYKRQGSSLITANSIIGADAVVDVSIAPGRLGSVSATINGRSEFYEARSRGMSLLESGRRVKVIDSTGTVLIVE